MQAHKNSLWLIAALAGCSAPATSTPTVLGMSFARAGFYDAPFPSDDLRSGGKVSLAGFPNPDANALVNSSLAMLKGADGFAQTGAIYFSANAALDPTSLPDLAGSILPESPVFLVGVDPKSPDYHQRRPLDIAFLADGGPLGAPNMLALLPVQGLPLRPGTRYAAVVTPGVRDAQGQPIAPSAAMQAIAAGTRPSGISDDGWASYLAALSALFDGGTDASQIAALAVFTTGNPTAGLSTVRDDILSRSAPPVSAPAAGDTFPDFCVFNATIEMPVYQNGKSPYQTSGGEWQFDAMGKPIVDHMEMARVIFSIPRGPTPAGGWPLVVFIRTGGGGDRPLVDRGVCATPLYTTATVPGSGPARDFAQIGWAGVEVDGPIGGIRNPTGADEDLSIFNVFNPPALRDNIRQSAVELVLFAHAVAPVTFDASSCAGAGMVSFDGKHLALMGHSMGGWIAPLTLANEPSYGAAILSGAGGSYIANVMDKTMPTSVRHPVEILLGYDNRQRMLERHDPALSLLQWAAEPSDPQVYDARIVREPAAMGSKTHVLMEQGIVDHYILPSIANSTSLALGLDEGGPAYDATSAEEMMLGQTPLGKLLGYGGRSAITLPASANQGTATAVVVQHPGDMIEDGHEVIFQTEAPKHQYRCFLRSWAKGMPPVVVPDGKESDPCP
jgi:hypothetical protein